jgi:hypothetical protein
MKNGWFIGNFTPSCYITDKFECALKKYKAGDSEQKHYHKIAHEYTLISSGTIKMNGVIYEEGCIIEMEPNEITDFIALTDTLTFVIKVPSIPNDKYEIY